MDRASLSIEREAAKSKLQELQKWGKVISATASIAFAAASTLALVVFAPAVLTGIGAFFVAQGMRTVVGMTLFSAVAAIASSQLGEVYKYKNELGDRNVFLLEVDAFLDACAKAKLQDVVVFHNKRDKVQDMNGLALHMAKSYPSIQLIDFVERPEPNVDKVLSAIVFLGDELLKDNSFWYAFKLVLAKDVKVFVQGKLSLRMKRLLVEGITKNDLSALLPGCELDLVYLAKMLLSIQPLVLFDGELKDIMEKAWVAGLVSTIKTKSETDLAKALAKEEKAGIDKAKEKFRNAGGKLEDCNVALIGEMDSGKSCMVNSFVGEKVAPFKRGECTDRVRSYRSPAGKTVFWDHPGIGGTFVPNTSNYVETNHLLAYNLVVIVCNSSVNQILKSIISELNMFRIEFILVRTHVENNVEENEEESGLSAEETCDEIRMRLANDLASVRVVSEVFPIFLVCAKMGKRELFDGPKLTDLIERYAEMV